MANRKFIVRQLRFWQMALPIIMFILSAYLVLRLEYPLAGFTDWLLWISRLDPLLLFAYSGATHLVPPWVWLPILVLLVTAFAGRIFCGWICPVGGLLGLLHSFVGCWSRQSGLGVLTGLKYGWLLIVLAVFFAGSGALLILTPSALLSHEIRQIYAGQFPWLLIAALGLGLILFPRFWCVYICPSGILLSAVASVRPARLQTSDGCVDCGLCRKVCPVKAAPGKPGAMGNACLLCGRCWSVCPTQAVTWQQTGHSGEGTGQTRRAFIAAGIAVIGAASLNFFAPKLFGSSRVAAQILRPPGALPEGDFLATCNRCARCIKVCPSEGLVPMPIDKGVLTFETPQLVPRKGRCELCMLCPKVCPTGALQDVAVEDVRIGMANINKNTCLAWAEGKRCLVCAEQCPVHAVVMDAAKRPAIDAEKCIGCGACENCCPVEDPAVVVSPKG